MSVDLPCRHCFHICSSVTLTADAASSFLPAEMSEASVANSELKLEGQKRKAPEDGEQGGTPEKVARDTVTNERWIQNWKRKFTPFHEGVPNK